MNILLHHGPGLISWAIRWQTRGFYNHASLLFSDGTVIESRERRGVQKIHVDAIRRAIGRDRRLRVDVYSFEGGISRVEERAARAFAESQLGLRYDYLDILAFLTRRRQAEDDAWFCSELVAATCRAIGRPLHHETCDWEVSPSEIARSLAIAQTGRLAPISL